MSTNIKNIRITRFLDHYRVSFYSDSKLLIAPTFPLSTSVEILLRSLLSEFKMNDIKVIANESKTIHSHEDELLKYIDYRSRSEKYTFDALALNNFSDFIIRRILEGHSISYMCTKSKFDTISVVNNIIYFNDLEVSQIIPGYRYFILSNKIHNIIILSGLNSISNITSFLKGCHFSVPVNSFDEPHGLTDLTKKIIESQVIPRFENPSFLLANESKIGDLEEKILLEGVNKNDPRAIRRHQLILNQRERYLEEEALLARGCPVTFLKTETGKPFEDISTDPKTLLDSKPVIPTPAPSSPILGLDTPNTDPIINTATTFVPSLSDIRLDTSKTEPIMSAASVSSNEIDTTLVPGKKINIDKDTTLSDNIYFEEDLIDSQCKKSFKVDKHGNILDEKEYKPDR